MGRIARETGREARHLADPLPVRVVAERRGGRRRAAVGERGQLVVGVIGEGAVEGMAMKALDSEGRRAAGSITGKWS